MLEERWAMTKWITSYIDENTDKCEKEKKERELQEMARRKTRFEKFI